MKRADGKYDVTINVEARKFKADAKGNEAEVPVDDWIDIGAFAKPAHGKKYGDTLYRQRMHITQRNSTFTFTTAQLPEKAGIDPFALLIDRIPDDNVKKVACSQGLHCNHRARHAELSKSPLVSSVRLVASPGIVAERQADGK